MNLFKIIKASIAGVFTGSFFMVIVPSSLVILNIEKGLPVMKVDFLYYLGLLMIVLPAIYFWYCAGLFSFYGSGTPAPIEPPKKLVIKGVYRYTRNPMYICYFLIILGEFFIFGYFLLFIYFLFIVIFLNAYVIFFEEPALLRRFGKDYSEYRQNVPRWFIK